MIKENDFFFVKQYNKCNQVVDINTCIGDLTSQSVPKNCQ